MKVHNISLENLDVLQKLANQADVKIVNNAEKALFWATCEAETLGTSGILGANIDCSNGVKLRFEGKHNGIGVIGAFVGTGPGALVVAPDSLIGKEVRYVVAATPTVGIVAFNVTWFDVGNMSGGGLGGFVPPSIGTGKFTRR